MKITVEKLIYYNVLLIAFCIPLYKALMAPLILLFVILSLFKFIKSKEYFFNFNIVPYLLIGIYLLYALSLFRSTNLNEALFDLEIKLSILVLPLFFILGNLNLNNSKLKKIYIAYIIGIVTGTIICLTNATFLYFETKAFYYSFAYSSLSILHHPSYFSLYLNFAIVIALVLNHKKTLSNLITLILVLFLLVVIWILMSRTGIITAGLILFSYWVSFLFQKRYNYFFAGLIVLILGLFSLLSISSYTLKRFKSTPDILLSIFEKEESEQPIVDDGSRKILWLSSTELIKRNFLLGVGNGDVRDELNKVYIENHFYQSLNKKLNPHNQFLQTWIAIGVLGFLLLVLIFIVTSVNAIRNKNLIALGLSLLLFMNFLTESMLETQSGVVFFSFFMSVLFINNRKIKPKV